METTSIISPNSKKCKPFAHESLQPRLFDPDRMDEAPSAHAYEVVRRVRRRLRQVEKEEQARAREGSRETPWWFDK